MNKISNRTDTMLFIFVFLGILGIFAYQMILVLYIMNKFSDYHYLIEGILSVVYIIVFSFLFKPFSWSRKLISENSSRKKKVVAIIVAVVLVAIKTIGALVINIHEITDYSYLLKPETIMNMFMVFLGVSFEEILFKGGMLRLLDARLPKCISLFLVCLVFTMIHWSYTPLMILTVFVSQLIDLLLFQMYPSIIFFSIIHFGFDIVLFL